MPSPGFLQPGDHVLAGRTQSNSDDAKQCQSPVGDLAGWANLGRLFVLMVGRLFQAKLRSMSVSQIDELAR